MDKIEERLHDTSKNCFECYEAWAKNKKDVDTREKLQEAIHELRRVASRLEIELATSERDEMTKRPLPIPPHRDAQRGKRSNKNEADGNVDPATVEVKKKSSPRGKGRSGPAKKSASN